MGSFLQRYLLIIVLYCASQVKAQVVVDKNNRPIPDLKVSCANDTTLTDENGRFQLNCPDKIYFFSLDDSELKMKAINDTIRLSTYGEIIEFEITAKQYRHFDIGYLPPIKGVQIATGTNQIIEVDRQSGAKATGNPRELFAKVPGLNIWESDGAGIQMGIGGRGLSPNRAANFNMRQNGYDISADALGYPESYYTPPVEVLSSIEIIRGSASLQYGTQFGGLMNFVLKDPADVPLQVQARLTYGSFNFLNGLLRVSGQSRHWFYQAYSQQKIGEAFRPNGGFTQNQSFAQIGYRFNESASIRLEYTHMNYLAQQSGGLTDAQFKANHRQSVRERNWFSVDWNMLAAHYDWEISKKTVFNVRAFGMRSNRQSLGYLGKINTVDPNGLREMIAGEFRNQGLEARILHRFSGKKIKDGATLLGLRAYQGNSSSLQGLASDRKDADFTFRNENDLEISDFNFPSVNLSLFSDNLFYFGKHWSLNLGARLEYIQSTAEGFYKRYVIHPLNFDTLQVYKIEEENTLSRTVPLIGTGIGYKLKRLSIYGNYCMNYRAVNFTDIRVNNPNILVDTAMRDEYGSSSELGIRGFVCKAWYIDLATFYIFYGDKIGLAPDATGFKKVRTNIGDAQNYGIEFFTELDVFRLVKKEAKQSLTVFTNASYIQAEYIRSREASYIGNTVEYVPELILRNGIKWRSEKFQIQLQTSYTAKQFSDASNAVLPSADAVIGEIPSYFVMDFSVRYKMNTSFQFEAGMNNVLSEKYYTRRASAYPGPGILPSDGRSFYVSAQYVIDWKK